jgi:hypothetical protein
VADRSEPEASRPEWHGDGMAVRTTASRTWPRWHQLGRWVGPVQADTSLVGKLPKVAAGCAPLGFSAARALS